MLQEGYLARAGAVIRRVSQWVSPITERQQARLIARYEQVASKSYLGPGATGRAFIHGKGIGRTP